MQEHAQSCWHSFHKNDNSITIVLIITIIITIIIITMIIITIIVIKIVVKTITTLCSS